MGFLPGNFDQKCAVNLSESARTIIWNDMWLFSCKGLATYLNRVLKNYCRQAQATVSERANEETSRLESLLETLSASLSIEQRKVVVTALIKSFTETLVLKNENNEEGEAVSFRLNDYNYDFLTSLSQDELYYKHGERSRGRYLKALFEEYCRLEHSQREQVYFRETLQTIDSAIKEQKRVLVNYYDPKRTKASETVIPLAWSVDRVSGYTCFLALKDGGKSIESASYRVCRIESLRKKPEAYHRSEYSDAAKRYRRKFEEDGSASLGHSDTTIIRLVSVTPDEIVSRTKPVAQLRPTDEPDVYSLSCSSKLARDILLPLGNRVIVLSPPELKDSLVKFYSDAVRGYEGL
jgi:hypothetical protein